jgi:hypothetical protein
MRTFSLSFHQLSFPYMETIGEPSNFTEMAAHKTQQEKTGPICPKTSRVLPKISPFLARGREPITRSRAFHFQVFARKEREVIAPAP